MDQYRKQIAVVILLLIFTTLFSHNVRSDFPLIFQKDLHAHDEASNSVVAANITRNFFPPMVRVNPLNEQQGIWMEGPFWQHIPPMFAYVPYIFFELDGEVTIEMKRLAYAFLILLTGLLFIALVYAYSKSLWAAIAATLAAIFWVDTPFTHELITGYAFGASDIVLAFTVIFGLDGVLWYLHKPKEERLNYPWWKIGLMGILVAFPIMAKNLLGAIPAAILFFALLKDYKGLSKNFIYGFSFFVGSLVLYYLPLLISSPETFKSEILVSFFHAANYEGWGRPWHYYVSNYLPQRYLFGWSWVYLIGLIFGIGYLFFGKLERIQKLLLSIPLLWFIWNLVAISLVESKIANFIFQSYLLSLFFIVYSVLLFIKSRLGGINNQSISQRFVTPSIVMVLFFSILVTGWQLIKLGQQFNSHRVQAYNYDSEEENFYQAAEELRELNLDSNDLTIVRVSENDCWFRYYILFLTGAESKTLLEMKFGYNSNTIKEKYDQMYFILEKQTGISEVENYSYIEFDINKMDVNQIDESIKAFLSIHSLDLEQEILRIKKDKTSCQWLVPDYILNAP